MRSITAAELARNSGEVLDRVLLGEPICVIRNRRAIAYLIPAKQAMTAAQAISGLVGKLTPEGGDSWLKESREENQVQIRASSTPPRKRG